VKQTGNEITFWYYRCQHNITSDGLYAIGFYAVGQ